jgi:hypothetical protein
MVGVIAGCEPNCSSQGRKNFTLSPFCCSSRERMSATAVGGDDHLHDMHAPVRPAPSTRAHTKRPFILCDFIYDKCPQILWSLRWRTNFRPHLTLCVLDFLRRRMADELMTPISCRFLGWREATEGFMT